MEVKDADRDWFEWLFRHVTGLVVNDVAEITGELDGDQTAKLIGTLAGFVMAEHDHSNPRPDGRKWVELFDELMERYGKENNEDGGGGQGFYRG